jgi:hypothetical protein
MLSRTARYARHCARSCALAAIAVHGSAGCVREHTLFEAQAEGGSAGSAGTAGASGTTSDAGAAGNSGSTSGGAPGQAGSTGASAPWTKASCVAALSAGKTGDACVAPFQCSAMADCCQINAYCKADTLVLESACDRCATSCSADSDCGPGALCENYQCLPCPADPCPASWLPVVRNGCSVCVPKSQCKSDQDCSGGQICSAGFSCLPGCKNDPGCCFGNQCATAACGPPIGVDCLLVGCPPGSLCKAGTDAAACKCDPQLNQWTCSPKPSNLCITR